MAFQNSLATSSSLKFNTGSFILSFGHIPFIPFPYLFLFSTDSKVHLLETFVNNILVYNVKVHHGNKLPKILVTYFETLKNCAGLGFLVLEWQYFVQL